MAHTHQDEEHHATPAGVQKALKGLDYPASKDELIARARQNAAPDDVVEMIRRLPGEEFHGPTDVMKAYGKVE